MSVSVVLGATWGGQLLHQAATLRDFQNQFLAFALTGIAIALGPLLLLVPQLRVARQLGWLRYGEFGLQYCRAFRRRWLLVFPREAPLGTADIQSLSDLANSHQVVEKMRLFPFGKELVISLAAMMVIPMLPLGLSVFSLPELLETVGRIALGGRG
jgi:hypothetical protein